jgi:diguanylate cyclase (GGDEF)-like protein
MKRSSYCPKETENNKAVLLYIDLDSFKAINDMYGHVVEDMRLPSLWEVLPLQRRGVHPPLAHKLADQD